MCKNPPWHQEGKGSNNARVQVSLRELKILSFRAAICLAVVDTYRELPFTALPIDVFVDFRFASEHSL